MPFNQIYQSCYETSSGFRGITRHWLSIYLLVGVKLLFVLQLGENAKWQGSWVSWGICICFADLGKGAQLDSGNTEMRKESWPQTADMNQSLWVSTHNLLGFLLWPDQCRQKTKKVLAIKTVNNWKKPLLQCVATAPVIWMLLRSILEQGCIYFYAFPSSLIGVREEVTHKQEDKPAQPRDLYNTLIP